MDLSNRINATQQQRRADSQTGHNASRLLKAEREFAWAELRITHPWVAPYAKPKELPYELKRLRREAEWIDARQKEDRVFLFGDHRLDELTSVPKERELRERKLDRWKKINQRRYFWSFIDSYSNDENKERQSRHGRQLKQTREEAREESEGEKMKHEKTVQLLKGEADNESAGATEQGKLALLPSIFPFPAPTFRRGVNK